MKLSLDEITDWKLFEALAHAYFLKEKEVRTVRDIINIEIKKSGTGPDDGQDLILDILVTDGITEFKRKWVVQCKFYDEDIAPSHLYDDNIPTLIHSYGADGYLLICKRDPTAKLTRLFDRLNDKCTFKYSYQIWTGEQFCRNIEKL
jgi:hypothetical protein